MRFPCLTGTERVAKGPQPMRSRDAVDIGFLSCVFIPNTCQLSHSIQIFARPESPRCDYDQRFLPITAAPGASVAQLVRGATSLAGDPGFDPTCLAVGVSSGKKNPSFFPILDPDV